MNVFEYVVTPSADGYEARTPYREVVFLGSTEREAVGAMLKGMAELAWKGSLDPEAPERKGSPPLQHTMSILSDHLRWHLERRREQIDDSPGIPAGQERLPDLTRTNDVISGLATSIAALARIKAL